MSDRETGVEEARKVLGKLVDDAALEGAVTFLTRRGRRHAAIVPIDRILQEERMSTTQTVPAEINTLINDTLADVGAGNTEDDGASIGEIANAIEVHVIPAVMRMVREQVAQEAKEVAAEFDGKEAMRAEVAILRWFAERILAS